jgi:hypothetical protein
MQPLRPASFPDPTAGVSGKLLSSTLALCRLSATLLVSVLVASVGEQSTRTCTTMPPHPPRRSHLPSCLPTATAPPGGPASQMRARAPETRVADARAVFSRRCPRIAPRSDPVTQRRRQLLRAPSDTTLRSPDFALRGSAPFFFVCAACPQDTPRVASHSRAGALSVTSLTSWSSPAPFPPQQGCRKGA